MRRTLPRVAILIAAAAAVAMPVAAAARPFQEEWVYRVRYGYQAEWWGIFRKYQIAILDREKQLGYVTSYSVVRPGLHTSEADRWDYRIVITFADADAASHESEAEKALFPDRDALQKAEQRRWELTLNHWDLPIREVDPHAE